MELAKRIEQLFKDRCAEFKKKYSLNFGVYYTPAENLCYTAMKKFKSEYGEIPNVSDKDFFTNSMHVPVWKDIDPFEKIDIESQLTGYSSGAGEGQATAGEGTSTSPTGGDELCHAQPAGWQWANPPRPAVHSRADPSIPGDDGQPSRARQSFFPDSGVHPLPELYPKGPRPDLPTA